MLNIPIFSEELICSLSVLVTLLFPTAPLKFIAHAIQFKRNLNRIIVGQRTEVS